MSSGKKNTSPARTGKFGLLGTVLILVGVAVPLITYNSDRARYIRAEKQVTILSLALQAFHRDMGKWPTRGARGRDGTLSILVSGSASKRGTRIRSNGWHTDTQTEDVDFIANHLLHNRPKGLSSYPGMGRNAWRGPYIKDAPLDPWGTPYLINIGVTAHANGGAGLVVSAGPDRVVNTPYDGSAGQEPVGDDIVTPFYVRSRQSEESLLGRSSP
ncbi:MAG: type II secretion system protein GspG [Leptospirillia bacterium]